MAERYENTRSGCDRRHTDDHGDVEYCDAHSGTTTGIKGLYALLVVLIGLIGAQMMVQIPNIKIDILNEVKGITARIVELEKKDIEVNATMRELAARVADLEKKTHN